MKKFLKDMKLNRVFGINLIIGIFFTIIVVLNIWLFFQTDFQSGKEIECIYTIVFDIIVIAIAIIINYNLNKNSNFEKRDLIKNILLPLLLPTLFFTIFIVLLNIFQGEPSIASNK